ncbi:hypothetical protein D3C85_978610 [compost metagenome]
MKAFLRIAVLVQCRAIELRQAVGIGGKVRGHPVEDHADLGQVAGIDERGEVIGRTVAGARGKLRQWLIAPGATEGMLHDRHQLDVGEPQGLHVRDQALGKLCPVVLASDLTGIVDFALPGTGMQLIDRQRRARPLTLAAALHPVRVLPVDGQGRGNFRRRVGGHLGGQRHGVGLERQNPVGAEDFVLVGFSRLQARNEHLPDPGRMAQAHRMAATIPHVEITDHRDPARIGGPDRKAHTVHTVDGLQLCAQAGAELPMVAFGKQVQVHLAQQRTKTVGILRGLFAAGPLGAQQVSLCPVEMANEQPGNFGGIQATKLLTGVTGDHLHAQGVRQVGPNELAARVVGMGAEYRKRILVFGAHQRLDVPRRRKQRLFHMSPLFHDSSFMTALHRLQKRVPGHSTTRTNRATARPTNRDDFQLHTPLHRPPFPD